MSEYQYYEFQAVDRPLTPSQIAELRTLSTRARITPTQLQNVYHWGDFRGKPLDLMERYFDAFVYVANWGTQQFMLRLPRGVLDARTAETYAGEAFLNVHTRGDAVILEFISDDEGMGWIMDEEAESWMPALLPVRAELANGDTRALYIGWLSGAVSGELDDEEREPPVPPGLGSLSASLTALASFLRVSDDLLAVAAADSSDLPPGPTAGDLQRWIATLPSAEKDELLFLLADDAARARAEVTRRFRQASTQPVAARAGQRTVAQLMAAAEERTTAREREEAARQEAARVRREREEAIARDRYLDSLVGREEERWHEIDALIAMKRAKEYDQAVQLLVDLRDLSIRQDDFESFAARLGALRERFAKLRGLHDRLDRAGLEV